MRASHGDGEWDGTLWSEHRSVDLADIKVVYWNRPNAFEFPDLSESDAHWARGAARIGLGGVLTSLDALWMNHPGRASAAEFKPAQLRTARSVGLNTPRTLITNSPDAVTRFARTINGPLITKPVGTPYITHSAGAESMYTRPVDLTALESVEAAAHLFQERIEKDHEIRMIVIDGVCHSVRIDAGNDQARVDWRSDYDALTYSPVPTPCVVACAVRSYMEVMGLTYAALDFIVQADGTWTFLEANPSGQWAWLTDSLPLATLISDTLGKWCSR